MATEREYLAEIKNKTRHTVEDLWRDFENLTTLAVDIPDGEQAYYTYPRTKGGWRLPKDTPDASKSHEMIMLPVRDDKFVENAYLAVVPQPIVLHRKIADVLEELAYEMFGYYPKEDTLAARDYDVPMLIGRFDVVVDQRGNIQVCELDDVCSLWPAMAKMNPITESYLRVFEKQLGMPLYTAELFQYSDWPLDASPRVRMEYSHIWLFEDDGSKKTAYIPRSDRFRLAIQEEGGLRWRPSRLSAERGADHFEQILKRYYLHNEDHWRGDVNDALLLRHEDFSLNDVALSVRAFRDSPGFEEHMRRYGSRSISMSWYRDTKMPLVSANLAVLAKNLDLAAQFADEWIAAHPGEMVVFKTLYGARTEGTAIYSKKGTKKKGVSSIRQVRRKFGIAAEDAIVIQPYKEPITLGEVGVTFVGDEATPADEYSDRSYIRSVKHLGYEKPAERVLHGYEDAFSMILRSFIIYLPVEKRLVHAGGLWQATDGRIVHGGGHSVAGPLYIQGLKGHPDWPVNDDLLAAESLLEKI